MLGFPVCEGDSMAAAVLRCSLPVFRALAVALLQVVWAEISTLENSLPTSCVGLAVPTVPSVYPTPLSFWLAKLPVHRPPSPGFLTCPGHDSALFFKFLCGLHTVTLVPGGPVLSSPLPPAKKKKITQSPSGLATILQSFKQF